MNTSTAMQFLVDDLIPEDSFLAIYGLSKSGKRAFALQMALHVAAGRSWQGHAVKQGTVVYMTRDGERMRQTRLDVVCDHYGISGKIPFHFGVGGMKRSKLYEPTLIVMDGITSSDADFILQGRAGRELFGCTLLGVHHAGRGMPPMINDVDGAFTVSRKGGFALITGAVGASTMEIPVLS